MSASEYISAALNNNHISPVYYQTLSKAQRSWELSLTWFWLVEVPWKCRNCCRKLTLGRKGPQLLGAPNGASNSVSLPLCFSLSQYHEICTHIGRYTARYIALIIPYILGKVQIFQTFTRSWRDKTQKRKKWRDKKCKWIQKHFKRRHRWIIEDKRAKQSKIQKAKYQTDKKTGS